MSTEEKGPGPNRIDWQDYGTGPQRWSLWGGPAKRNAEQVFELWGACEVYRRVEPNRPVVYMVKMAHDGKWRYGHSDSTSIYLDESRLYTAKDGAEAWLLHEAQVRIDNVLLAVNTLLDELEKLDFRTGAQQGYAIPLNQLFLDLETYRDTVSVLPELYERVGPSTTDGGPV